MISILSFCCESAVKNSPMLEFRLFSFPFDVEQQQGGGCERHPCLWSQITFLDVVPISFWVLSASFFHWDHGGAFEQLL